MNHQTGTFFIYLLRRVHIYDLPGQAVPSCCSAIKQEDRDVSFSAKPAHTIAFGTHRTDAAQPLGNGRRAMADKGGHAFLWP